MLGNRSYLYVAGHDSSGLEQAFEHGADAVVLDLEDGVPPERRPEARELVAAVLRSRQAWVRINPAGSADAVLDLEAVGLPAAGVRLPKTTSPDDARWAVQRIAGRPLICSIESAAGLLAAPEIARVAGVSALSLGAGDMAADLGCGPAWADLLQARSEIVAASSAAALGPPVDGVFFDLSDTEGLREEALASRGLGFYGKSTLHPSQVATINEVFTGT